MRKQIDVKTEGQQTINDIPQFLRKPEPQVIEGQALAELVQLPRLCRNRKCRRAKLCLGPDLRCLTDHAGIGVLRWRGMEPRQREATLRQRVEAKVAEEQGVSPLNIDLGRSTVARVEAGPVRASRVGEG